MYSHYDYIEEDQNAYLFKVKYFCEKVPLFSRFIIASVLSYYLFTWLNYFFADMLSDIPYFVLKNFEFYRLISGTFVHYNFFEMILGLYFVIPLIIDKEKKMGTMEFIYDFFLKNLMIQFLFLSVMMACGLANPKYFLVQKSSGLLNYYIFNLTVKAFVSPQEMTNFLCFPNKIKVRYYLIFLVILVNLLLHLKFDVFVSIFLGLVEAFCYKNTFNLSRDRILDLETSEYLIYLANLPNFISYLESQANLHIIDIISLNPESNENAYRQEFELSGVKTENGNIKNQKENEFIINNGNKEILLDETLNSTEEELREEKQKNLN